jgi:hypothetical protein
VSSHKKGTPLISFHIHSFVVFHTDLQKNTIVTCILTSRNHIMSNMQDHLLQLMQLIQYRHVSSFSAVITNKFIGEEFYPSPNYLDGYEAMGFDVSQLTQDEEQSLLTLKTDMPIPMLVYGDSFQWANHGHHILPPSTDLTSNIKAGLHRTFWNSLIEFLCTDLDGNLSSILNPLTACRLDHYLSRLFEGLSETRSKGEMFDQHLLNEICKDQFIKKIVDIALFATQLPLSIFTSLFHQKFEKHSMLESTLKYYSSSTFKWRQNQMTFTFFLEIFFSIHIAVYQMWPASYSSWFNWRNSIPCTLCNVISLEHDSNP